MADIPENGCIDRNQALKRRRWHMALDKLSKLESGRYGWTHYPKGSKADDEMRMLRLRGDGKA